MSGRHPVNPRRRRPGRSYPRYREPLPPGISSGCMVGDLLVPLLGARRVLTIAAEGGLLPYLVRRLVARVAALASSA